jgi:predicted dehydrogenase
MKTDERIGVGFVGAGAVVKTIHVPVLGQMEQDFRIEAVWDIDSTAAESLAQQVGSRALPGFEDMLTDPRVEVIVIATPAAFHAEHVAAGMKAGKRAILCEKPFGASLDDIRLVEEAAATCDVPLLIGAMHAFDPGWSAVAETVAHMRENAVAIRSSIVLPFNEQFEQWATELPPKVPPSFNTDDIATLLIRMGIMELAIHNLPLVRAMIPEGAPITVTSAMPLEPFGYALSLAADDRVIDLFGYIFDSWKPSWELEAVSTDRSLFLEFTPSFIHAGSATARIIGARGTDIVGPFARNGYQMEWQAIRELAHGRPFPIPSLAQVIGDFRFALDIVEQSCAKIAAGAGK